MSVGIYLQERSGRSKILSLFISFYELFAVTPRKPILSIHNVVTLENVKHYCNRLSFLFSEVLHIYNYVVIKWGITVFRKNLRYCTLYHLQYYYVACHIHPYPYKVFVKEVRTCVNFIRNSQVFIS